ncbi:MAG TPA: HNH endonuclease signature motif containing protein [Patescibacteria group bacterium]|nr:HNH endonuclease signature motif containing protein [Patescibacteria group bacterium]
MKKGSVIILIIVVLAVAGIYILTTKHTTQPTSTVPQANDSSITIIGQQTKTSGCTASGGLEDKACTPGAIISTASKDQICVSGYSKSVRDVPTSEKDQVYQEYGIVSHATGQYEVDHLISLELGGSNDIANLWPEAADPTPGFHQKDTVENYLHSRVCNGSIPLAQAQQEIATDWLAVYNQIHP